LALPPPLLVLMLLGMLDMLDDDDCYRQRKAGGRWREGATK